MRLHSVERVRGAARSRVACWAMLASMTALDGILSQLRDHEDQLRARGAVRIGIFGSYSRGEQHEGSDLDVLVELDERTFDRYMDLRFYLEDLLGVPIDLVQTDRIRPELREQIQDELIDVTERGGASVGHSAGPH